MREAGVPSRRDEGSIFTRKIRVLLVDHNKDWLISTANVLDACAYNVTAVEHAKTALLVLSERKDDIDLVIVDIDIPDLDALTLLRLAVNMDLLAICMLIYGSHNSIMSANEDDMMIKRAIEIGAFLMIEKPVTKEALKYLWQDVMWQRTIRRDTKYGEKDKRLSQMSVMDENLKRDDESNGKPSKEDKGSESSDKHNHGASTKTFKSRKSSRKDDQGKPGNNNNGGRVKRKVCTEWTDELHSKFMDAVDQLGEGRCYPKEILELMKVPGLTRMQVASHLQKCRTDNWRAPEERRAHPPCAPASSRHNSNNNYPQPQQKSGPRKFGLMPHLLKKPNNAQPHLHEGPEILHPSMEMEQHINPLPYFEPQQYGGQSFAQDFAVENVQQLGANKIFSGAYNTIDQQLDISNINSHQKFGTLADMTYHQALDPILPYFSGAGFGGTSYLDSSSQRQPPTETFGFFSELDEFAQNYPSFPEGSLINQSLKARNPAVDFEGYSEQLPVAPSTETKGEWMPETSNIFGES
ncbi:hypothetical protein RJ639_046090 [Escallonia herrerae]|uniref:Two-component response regulator n=1 Tax=Escallonia herrerae TaxID=1293975 RepID=A0AA88W8G8_9ASTE|nr:hypothetical protein RJ639_046090 [Escallonia herrerae]